MYTLFLTSTADSRLDLSGQRAIDVDDCATAYLDGSCLGRERSISLWLPGQRWHAIRCGGKIWLMVGEARPHWVQRCSNQGCKQSGALAGMCMHASNAHWTACCHTRPISHAFPHRRIEYWSGATAGSLMLQCSGPDIPRQRVPPANLRTVVPSG